MIERVIAEIGTREVSFLAYQTSIFLSKLRIPYGFV